MELTRVTSRVGTLALVALAVLVFAPREACAAAPQGNEKIELHHYSPEVEKLAPVEDLVPPFRLSDLTCERVERDARLFEEHHPFTLPLPEQGPESLDLTVRYYRLELLVSADLSSSERPFTPRVDGDSNDTYFWMRASFDVTDGLTVFVESFQGANSIVPPNTAIVPPKTAWDGFQFEAGIKAHLGERWTLEAGPVLYALSATERPRQIGTRISLACDF